jgi:holo-[acyl-carrier protein] synthase
MIYGIGIDIVDVSRIEKAMERWGDRFLGRVFTQNEIKYCSNKVRQATRFALRFAAKEAFTKALGLGLRGGLGFQQIEVLRSPEGQPHLSLHGRAEDLYKRRGINNSFLSLSDDGLYAVAVVILEA